MKFVGHVTKVLQIYSFTFKQTERNNNMRTETKTYKIYKFDELSEQAQSNVMTLLLHINVEHDWWEYIGDELNRQGSKLVGFDIGRSNYCELEISDCESFAKEIVNDHGKTCDTYKLASEFLESLTDDDDLNNELEHEFKRAISEEYLSMLRREYEYLTSEEAIKETIECNEYEFTEDGRIY